MTIRWKLNLSVLALIGVFLLAAGISIRAVSQNAAQTRSYARMREQSQLTADIRTQIYQHLGSMGSLTGARDDPSRDWPRLALDDVDIQIRLSREPRERELWENVRSVLAAIPQPRPAGEAGGPPEETVIPLIERAERELRELRGYYDSAQYLSIAATAHTSLMAQAAVGLACLLTVVLFLVHLLILRRWLLRPIEVLKSSSEVIGQGRLDHQVPLKGSDELAQLARSVEAMARGLAAHQAALIQARELSTLGELCANVAHGLRNPLAALRASAQLAELRLAEIPEGPARQAGSAGCAPAAARSLIRDLAEQADRLDERINRLFELSRPLELQLRPVTFRELAMAVGAQVFPLLKSRRAELHIEDQTGGAVWRLDDEQLAHALAELVANAAHHSPHGSGVTIRGRVLGEEAPGSRHSTPTSRLPRGSAQRTRSAKSRIRRDEPAGRGGQRSAEDLPMCIGLHPEGEPEVLAAGTKTRIETPEQGRTPVLSSSAGLRTESTDHCASRTRLCVEVIDRGAGMTKATRDKVFDLFFTTRPEGTGIGLSMVRRFVERHQGEIEIETCPGAGTTVRIMI